jgi:hypothetical protein
VKEVNMDMEMGMDMDFPSRALLCFSITDDAQTGCRVEL